MAPAEATNCLNWCSTGTQFTSHSTEGGAMLGVQCRSSTRHIMKLQKQTLGYQTCVWGDKVVWPLRPSFLFPWSATLLLGND